MSSASQYHSLFDPMSLMQYWPKPFQLPKLLDTLNEPILPNGTFAGVVINENNTPNPQAERHIVSHYSYGTQLECLIDAVSVLVDDRAGKAASPENAAKLKRLQQLKEHVAALKNESARTRLEQIKSELGKLDEAGLKECAGVVTQLLHSKPPTRKRLR